MQFIYPDKDHDELRASGKYFTSFDEFALRDLSLLQKVVEDKFPEARKTRLALEAQRAAKPSA